MACDRDMVGRAGQFLKAFVPFCDRLRKGRQFVSSPTPEATVGVQIGSLTEDG